MEAVFTKFDAYQCYIANKDNFMHHTQCLVHAHAPCMHVTLTTIPRLPKCDFHPISSRCYNQPLAGLQLSSTYMTAN